MTDDVEKLRAKFEELGVERVRAKHRGMLWDRHTRAAAHQWLYEKDTQAKAHRESREQEDRDLDRSAVNAAWASARQARITNRISLAALGISLASAAIAIAAIYAQLAE